MTDEAALMLRIGIFGIVAAVVYWLISYEWLGSVALLTLGLGPGVAGLVMAVMDKSAHPSGRREQIRRLIGMPREVEGESLPPGDVVVIPSPTIWPFVLSLGFAIALTGLIFGLWLGLIGGILIGAGFWGWLDSVVREYQATRSLVEAVRSREEGQGR